MCSDSNFVNSVIALCHFCEVHGPVVVMCTQPYSNKYSKTLGSLQVTDETNTEDIKNYIHTNKLLQMLDLVTQENASNASRHASCPGCTSISKDGFPIISNDHTAHITYMSNQSPEDSALFTLLRHACIRSLTCEITPGEDGAIYFGEDTNVHVLSYRFKLQNALARGLRSTYSIVVLSKDKLALLNMWPFLVPNLKVLVTRLQDAAQQVFAEEQTAESGRAMRLGNSDLHPAANYRSRPGDMEPRSLASVTRQDNIFLKVHAWFAWILRVGGSVFSEWQPVSGEGGDELAIPPRDASVDQACELAVLHLRQLYLLLGVSLFSTLAFHAVIGNQIIVRSSTKAVAVAVAEAVSTLLPRGCVSMEHSDQTYLHTFQHNIISLDVGVPLPQEVTSIDADPCVVLLVEAKANPYPGDEVAKTTDLTADKVTVRMDSSQPPIVSSNYSLVTDTETPRVVDQYGHFLANQLGVRPALLAQSLLLVRNEWLNKAYLYYVFKRKQTGSRLSDPECAQRLHGFLKATGLSGQADHAVLRFWVRGLSDEAKRGVRSRLSKTDPGLVVEAAS